MNDLPAQHDSTDTVATPYDPGSFEELVQWGKYVVASSLCPDHITDPSDAVLIAHQGAALGLDPITALQNSHVVHGQVGFSADLLKGLCLRTGEVERWHYAEQTDEVCVLEVQRTGHDPQRYRWTIDQADRAGLTDSHVWRSYPAQMLRHRVDAEAARSVFPDVVSGLYTPSEQVEAADAAHGGARVEAADAAHGGARVEATVTDAEPSPAPTTDGAPDDTTDPDDGLASVEGESLLPDDPDDGVSDDDADALESTNGDADPLASVHRAIGQLIRHVDRPDGAGTAFTCALKERGSWADPGKCQSVREMLSDLDEQGRLDLMRQTVESTDGVEWPDDGADDAPWSEMGRSGRLDWMEERVPGVDLLREYAPDPETAMLALDACAEQYDCSVRDLPEYGLPGEVYTDLQTGGDVADDRIAELADGQVPF